MTDYIRIYESPRTRNELDEAEGLATKYHMATTMDDDGAVRWLSNGRVPPADIIDFWAYLGLPVNVAACTRKRDAETARFLAEYRANARPPSREERIEARAAHGPGVRLVNVITGKSFIT